MEAAKKEETPVVKMNPAQQCSNEINEVLKKYSCQLICDRQMMYGQPVYVPTIIPLEQGQK